MHLGRGGEVECGGGEGGGGGRGGGIVGGDDDDDDYDGDDDDDDDHDGEDDDDDDGGDDDDDDDDDDDGEEDDDDGDGDNDDDGRTIKPGPTPAEEAEIDRRQAEKKKEKEDKKRQNEEGIKKKAQMEEEKFKREMKKKLEQQLKEELQTIEEEEEGDEGAERLIRRRAGRGESSQMGEGLNVKPAEWYDQYAYSSDRIQETDEERDTFIAKLTSIDDQKEKDLMLEEKRAELHSKMLAAKRQELEERKRLQIEGARLQKELQEQKNKQIATEEKLALLTETVLHTKQEVAAINRTLQKVETNQYKFEGIWNTFLEKSAEDVDQHVKSYIEKLDNHITQTFTPAVIERIVKGSGGGGGDGDGDGDGVITRKERVSSEKKEQGRLIRSKLGSISEMKKKDKYVDHHHNGIRQAGNKSLLSYGPRLGIPGWTGFVPIEEGILIPIKDCTRHVEKTGNEIATSNLLKEKVAGEPTTYGRMGKHPSLAYKIIKEQGGGWWSRDASRTKKTKTGPLADKSIYKADIVKHSDFVKVAPPDDEGKENKKPHLGCSSRSSSPRPKYEEVAACINGMVQSYRFDSAYTLMAIDNPKVGGKVAAGLFKTRRLVAPTKEVNLILPDSEARPYEWRKSAPSQNPWDKECIFFQPDGLRNAPSMYTTCHGVRGSNPLAQSAVMSGSVSDQSSCRTWDLAMTKSGQQLPGYAGYIPSYSQRADARPRRNAKEDMLQFELDQYNHGHIPFYQGYLPKAVSNIKPSKGPTDRTVYGSTNASVQAELAKGPPLRTSQNARTDEVTKFFSNGKSEFVSFNGRTFAERYFHILRPKEGLPKILYPSKYNDHGSRFANQGLPPSVDLHIYRNGTRVARR
ncbi:hypothetical protein CBR_g8661 [Chara braunii]|uniref:Uncharacterized protein n=1 Tax=Chara braunii TaxID=69332 RepID=A0A388JS64_CHABU|nr:hypothetical protein CBR_g8661 [Chara braunii]|eukprot:GBG60641.1 hypothetical protein CBR_g8661 [Chara braunii]